MTSFSCPPVRVRPGAPKGPLTCGFTVSARHAECPNHVLLTLLIEKLVTFGDRGYQLLALRSPRPTHDTEHRRPAKNFPWDCDRPDAADSIFRFTQFGYIAVNQRPYEELPPIHSAGPFFQPARLRTRPSEEPSTGRYFLVVWVPAGGHPGPQETRAPAPLPGSAPHVEGARASESAVGFGWIRPRANLHSDQPSDCCTGDGAERAD